MAPKHRATGGTERRCYEIRVRGPIGPTVMHAFPTLAAGRSGHDTLLTGSLPDQSALYGVIHQLEALGLQLLEIRAPQCGATGATGQIDDPPQLLGAVMSESNGTPSVVLVHGGFVDGSGWQPVYRVLRDDGYPVAVVQHPTLSLDGDVAATRLIIDAQTGPVVLVGHSYGGAVITEAGNDPNVAALVYIAAFAPDAGESVNSLIANPPPGASIPPILPPRDGYLFLDRDKFPASFAGDVPADVAEFMADSQVPWGVDALGGTITDPAWRTKPSWYLLTTEDRMIPPPAQRMMAERAGATVTEVPASHSVFLSQPEPVAGVIRTALKQSRLPVRA